MMVSKGDTFETLLQSPSFVGTTRQSSEPSHADFATFNCASMADVRGLTRERY